MGLGPPSESPLERVTRLPRLTLEDPALSYVVLSARPRGPEMLGMTPLSPYRPFNTTEAFQSVIPTEGAKRPSGGIHSTRQARSGQACGVGIGSAIPSAPHRFLDSTFGLASNDIAFRIAENTRMALKVGQGPPYGTAQFVGPR